MIALARLAVAAALIVAISPVALAVDGFITTPVALICRDYFAVPEAEAAVTAHDASWLASTGCFHVKSGLSVNLMEWNGRIWSGRIQTPEGSYNAYFPNYSVTSPAETAMREEMQRQNISRNKANAPPAFK